jgi:hypothetical protein
MEGAFQLLIILFFIAASIFDAVARSRKKNEQKDRLDREEGEEAGTVTRAPGTRRPRPTEGRRKAPAPGAPRSKQHGRDGRDGARESSPSGGTRSEAPGEGRRTAADEMIPEDFWAILTGQAPKQEAPAPTPAPTKRTEVPPSEPHIPVPVPSDRYTPAPDEDLRDYGRSPVAKDRTIVAAKPVPGAPTRRSARWMEGLGGGAVEDAVRSPRPHTAGSRRPVDPMEEPWGVLEDISSGEIGDGLGSTQGAVDLTGGEALRRAGTTDSPYVRLVAEGTTENLRSAIVLREVLGTPVGARGPRDRIGGWDWED